MSLSERIKELETLRQNGQISEIEFTNLVREASQNFSPIITEQTTLAADDISNVNTTNKNLKISKKFIAVAVVLIIGLAGFFLTRPGSPTDSKEYKKLLSEEKELLKKQQDLSTKLKTYADIKTEVADYEERILTNQAILQDVNELSNP